MSITTRMDANTAVKSAPMVFTGSDMSKFTSMLYLQINHTRRILE